MNSFTPATSANILLISIPHFISNVNMIERAPPLVKMPARYNYLIYII